MPIHSANERVMALCYKPMVDAIVMVLSQNEFDEMQTPRGTSVIVQFIDDQVDL